MKFSFLAQLRGRGSVLSGNRRGEESAECILVGMLFSLPLVIFPARWVGLIVNVISPPSFWLVYDWR